MMMPMRKMMYPIQVVVLVAVVPVKTKTKIL